MTDIVITGAARTPIGAFNGGLRTIAASELGAVVIAAAMKRAGIAPEEPTEVIMGCRRLCTRIRRLTICRCPVACLRGL